MSPFIHSCGDLSGKSLQRICIIQVAYYVSIHEPWLRNALSDTGRPMWTQTLAIEYSGFAAIQLAR